MSKSFKRLLEPFQIGKVRLRNRMVRAPCALGMSELEGFVSEADKSYFEAVAKGGIGLITAGASYVDVPLGITDLRRFWVSDDKYIPGLREITKVVKKHGCPIFLELQHSGPSFPSHYFKDLQPVAASSLRQNELPPRLPIPFFPTRGLTVAEVEELVVKFADAAERARKAGFDGVVIEACHSYLINSFLSRAWNKRQDAYGCQDMKSRARFPVEIIQAVKERLDGDLLVGIRINGGEWGLKEGITSKESQAFAEIFENAGADYIDVSGIGYEPDYGFFLFPEQLLYPEPSEVARPLAKEVKKPGLEVSRAAAIKKVVSVPIVTVGRLHPELGEWILKKGMADLIAFGRRLIADPELPNKVASGKLEDIIPCMGGMECLEPASPGELTRCRVRPALGRENQFVLEAAKKKKRVMIVGGGPAGMEAALVAAHRGHKVTLYEKKPSLGGLLPLAALIKGVEIEDLPALVRYYRIQISKADVKVRLGREVSLRLIQRSSPDVVILATGGKWSLPQIPGVNGKNVLTSSDLQRRAEVYLRLFGPKLVRWLTKFYLPVGKRVVIVGGLIHGCETAEFLVKRGRRVTIVENSEELGGGIPVIRKARLLNWLKKKGVAMLSEVTYEEVTEKGLTIFGEGLGRKTIEADTVLITTAPEANIQLYEELKGKVPELYVIGDSKTPRLIADAIADGALIGRSI